jgi:hypothetical protein
MKNVTDHQSSSADKLEAVRRMIEEIENRSAELARRFLVPQRIRKYLSSTL